MCQFEEFSFACDGIEHPVFRHGSGPAVIEPKVKAAVSAQPARPPAIPPTRRRRANLGLSPEDLEAAASTGTPVLTLRFRHDAISPAARADAICAAFAPNAEAMVVPAEGGDGSARPPIRRRAHSPLTFDLVDRDGHPTRMALDRVVAFLGSALLGGDAR